MKSNLYEIIAGGKVPDRFTVLGITYAIRLIKPGEFHKAGLNGYIDYEQRVVLIDCNLSVTRQIEVLMHEVAHGVLEFFEIWDGVDEAARERICTAFARALPMIYFEVDR